tara:strand:+ start:1323 stop:1637 length:315 start_codon:yes stop_codon:yes gene_type:complete
MIETKYCISSIANNEEITLYKFDNLKSCLEKFLTIKPLDQCWWRMYKVDVVDQSVTRCGNIIYHWEMDYDFEGNDDCYISTYVNDWQEFVKQKLKGETNDLNKS